MQESEFTGCLNKVQGNPAIKREKHRNHGLFAPSRKNNPAAALTLRCASCTMNCVRALSSAVRAFGLHPKGRPFKSDSAHHCDASPLSGDVVQLVRTLPCRWLESRTVTANSLTCQTKRTRNPHILRYVRRTF